MSPPPLPRLQLSLWRLLPPGARQLSQPSPPALPVRPGPRREPARKRASCAVRKGGRRNRRGCAGAADRRPFFFKRSPFSLCVCAHGFRCTYGVEVGACVEGHGGLAVVARRRAGRREHGAQRVAHGKRRGHTERRCASGEEGTRKKCRRCDAAGQKAQCRLALCGGGERGGMRQGERQRRRTRGGWAKRERREKERGEGER